MKFGKVTHGSGHVTRIVGPDNERRGQPEEPEDEGNPIVVMASTIGVFLVGFLLAYVAIGPTLYAFDSDEDPTGHRRLTKLAFDYSSIFDVSLAPEALREKIASNCSKHKLEDDVDFRRVKFGEVLISFSRAQARVECTLALPKDNFCSPEAAQYAANLIVGYDTARAQVAGINKSVQNLSQSLGGSLKLLYTKLDQSFEQGVESVPGFNPGFDRPKNRLKLVPNALGKQYQNNSNTIRQLFQSPFPAVFDSAVASKIGSLSEAGYIKHSHFPSFGIMMPSGISDAMKTQIYAPNC